MPNPYRSPSQHKRYDGFEARTGSYRYSARLLASMIPYSEGLIYDAGCGTGNSTLEVLRRFVGSPVIGIDQSPEMLALARLKFSLRGTPERRDIDEDVAFAQFLQNFRSEARQFNGRVRFVETDLLSFDGVPARTIVGNHILHWLEPQEEAARKFYMLVETNGYVALSSSMSFYRSTKFKKHEVSYLYHPFTNAFFETLLRAIERETGKAASIPVEKEKKQATETIEMFESLGFAFHDYTEVMLPPISCETVLEYNLRVVPAHLGVFKGTEISEEIQTRLIEDALTDTLQNYGFLLPSNGLPLDVNPIFVFRKR